jgi:hypothetical protein
VVWHRIADFGNVACWVDGVTDCELDGEGTGAIRTVGLGKHSVRERLEAIDPEPTSCGIAPSNRTACPLGPWSARCGLPRSP